MTAFAASSAGDRIAYDRVGPEDAPTVVFVAGAGPHRATDPITRPTAELLAGRGIASVLFDRLGRGESVAEGVLDLDRELAAVAAMIGVAGGHAVLCGHSSGCSIALAAAVRGLPVDGLVLWEAPLKPPGSGSDDWSREFGRLLDAGELEAAQVEYMRDMPPEWLEGARRSPAWPHIVAQAGSLRADAESLAWAESAPHSELFSSIRVPVVAVVGEQAPPIMPAAAADLAASIGGAESRVIAGANHAWEPAAMAEMLAGFVPATAPVSG